MIGLVVIRVMDAQVVTEFVFGCAAKLTGEVVALSNGGLNRLAETGRVLAISNAALPHGIVFTRESVGNAQAPFSIGGVFKPALTGGFPLFFGPCVRDFLAGFGGVFPSASAWRFSFQDFTHALASFGRALVCRARFEKLGVALRAAFDTPSDRSTAIDAQIRLACVDLFAHGFSSIG